VRLAATVRPVATAPSPTAKSLSLDAQLKDYVKEGSNVSVSVGDYFC
jgi:hypothetical protein